MKTVQGIKKIQCKFIVLVIVFLILPFGIKVNAAENGVDVNLPVEQIFEVENENTISNEFKYCLFAVTDNAPMPKNSGQKNYIFYLKGNQRIDIEAINYTQSGVYEYDLYQVIEEEKGGYVYDKTVYRIIVHISYDSHNDFISEVTIANEKGLKVDRATFTNQVRIKNAASVANTMSKPSTGDNTDISAWYVLMSISSVFIFFGIWEKRKKAKI
ncbi:pilin isopeptide linkage protein [Breznakia sp. PF5-3]|uniref:Spy0128 family protein n=1 Tax=unclassified Breznakia TaxID=2623764 RepID=UPI0024070685|nr:MULTISPECIES: FctA domain-containing protein [unclassified Breznakia]MDL2276748.1 hypothetical protein [Breznakia sp. OttesenSCG-928-G09]MDF9825290.1 pilin isopeptide linkage protein [Breznakia sp. PM6-1]MDF9836164.1 pilin isopeptide linkage protein [Breznakia sp. PF5-3]MDF9837390.1 pilin isopeptide linkage protein [Breznakia sp. PFB2-8]MDF9859325.1 pilin isopeptide linkage protein [Breznakia sp. PH5-24]